MQQPQRRSDRTAGDESLARVVAAAGNDLVVASNRQPYRHGYDEDGSIEVDRPTGGLTAGLDAVMRQLDGTWIAWGDGDADHAVCDADGRVAVPPGSETGGYDLKRLWLSDEDVENYYYGFSNRVLWPICHSALTAVDGNGYYWDYYRDVNERFADAVSSAANDRPVIWLQDYHLALAPRMVAERTAEDAFVAHTWHVPWPSWDVFRSCPNAREILGGLLGADLLTFHVGRYCENFLNCVAAALPDVRVDRDAGRVHHRDGTTTVRAFPIGVPAERIAREARSPDAERFWPQFAAEHGLEDVQVGVGVDRLDYSKGIVQRVQAIERLFDEASGWRESFSFVQVGSESRSEIEAYSDYQAAVEDAVERVNDRFGTDEWEPIVYTTARLEDEEIYALYRHADVAIVSPIRDGMNLVAQEYVAAQRGPDATGGEHAGRGRGTHPGHGRGGARTTRRDPGSREPVQRLADRQRRPIARGRDNGDGDQGTDRDGVLVLSDQAGAHDVLGESVVSISPHDGPGFAAAIENALTMYPSERRSRMDDLHQYVRNNTTTSWMRDVFEAIRVLREPPGYDPLYDGSAQSVQPR